MSHASEGFHQRQKLSVVGGSAIVRPMKIHLNLPTTASRREPAVAMEDTPHTSSPTYESLAMAPSLDGELLGK